MYSELVMDHFSAPRNVGELVDPDGVGEIGNPECGDVVRLSIRVEDDRITDIRFKTFGCAAAVATSSMLTEMVKGKTLAEALTISNSAVAEALGGLPPQKMHCSNMAADALALAVDDYRARSAAAASGDEPGPAGRRRQDSSDEVSGGAADLCTLAFDDRSAGQAPDGGRGES